jgi:hypothetical protein
MTEAILTVKSVNSENEPTFGVTITVYDQNSVAQDSQVTDEAGLVHFTLPGDQWYEIYLFDHKKAEVWLHRDKEIIIDPVEKTYNVTASADDTHTTGKGANGYTDIENRFGQGSGTVHRLFFRWSIDVPDGATIDSAYLWIQASLEDTGAFTSYIRLMDQDSCADFTSSPHNLATTGSVSWSMPSFVADTWYSSPDLKTLVQSFIDRAGYSSGNYLGLRLDEGDANGDDRWAYLRDQGAAYAPKLVVTYSYGYDLTVNMKKGDGSTAWPSGETVRAWDSTDGYLEDKSE